jgi:hypothetical protein
MPACGRAPPPTCTLCICPSSPRCPPLRADGKAGLPARPARKPDTDMHLRCVLVRLVLGRDLGEFVAPPTDRDASAGAEAARPEGDGVAVSSTRCESTGNVREGYAWLPLRAEEGVF